MCDNEYFIGNMEFWNSDNTNSNGKSVDSHLPAVFGGIVRAKGGYNCFSNYILTF